MRSLIERYAADRGSLTRFYGGRTAETSDDVSAARRARMKEFYAGALSGLERVDFDKLEQADRIDFLVFRNRLAYELRQVEIEEKRLAETAPLLPFAGAILSLEDSLRRMEPLDAAKAAGAVNALRAQVEASKNAAEAAKPDKTVAFRAAEHVDRLRNTLKAWFGFYHGYDPQFTWWVDAPYQAADKALQDYAAFLREKIVGLKPGDTTTIVGKPAGREALMNDLAFEMIPYSPEELLEIADKEYAWCEAEMKKASRELGFGDDWHKALEHVKARYVEPGRQPALIRDLAIQAIEFIDKHELVTVPPLARETWRMEMMSPERQLVNPFFTGGEVISVSYPVNSMTYEQKMMTMRGNNAHFAHATVFHELIPGHHLQLFMASRYRPYRSSVSGTPFVTEGWALHWEMLLWDMGFHKTPEDRVGALFWRMHRAARIQFSLRFHLGKMTAQECIDFLVDKVGHERDNAAAEVRRSFNGSYPPLYQAAYMVGGLQMRALHRELVQSRKMTERAFHDAILMENRIPIEMIRAALTNQKLTREYRAAWMFYEAGRSR